MARRVIGGDTGLNERLLERILMGVQGRFRICVGKFRPLCDVRHMVCGGYP